MGPARFVVSTGTETWPVEVCEDGPGRYRVRVGEEWLEVEARAPASGPDSLLIGGAPYLVDVSDDGDEVVASVAGEVYRLRVREPGRRGRGPGGDAAHAGGERLVAPMPGKVIAVLVRAGERVDPGAPLLVLEAMKMENEFRATAGGVVSDVRVTPGQTVNAGDLLVVIEG